MMPSRVFQVPEHSAGVNTAAAMVRFNLSRFLTPAIVQPAFFAKRGRATGQFNRASTLCTDHKAINRGDMHVLDADEIAAMLSQPKPQCTTTERDRRRSQQIDPQ
jgi:hypothetical protein